MSTPRRRARLLFVAVGLMLFAVLAILLATSGSWAHRNGRMESDLAGESPVPANTGLVPPTPRNDGERSEEVGAPPPGRSKGPEPVLAEDGPTHAVLRGHVLTPDGQPPATAEVWLVHRGEVLYRCSIEPDGSFEMAPAGGRAYLVQVDPASLPPGLLAPAKQERSMVSAPPGLFARWVDIPSSGGTFEVELRVMPEATVSGQIVGPRDQPVPNAWIRIASAQPHCSVISYDTFADDNGFWSRSGVHPGPVTVRWSGASSPDAAFQDLPNSLPLEVEIEPGPWNDLGRLRLGSGPGSITGHVVNQDGIPVRDLTVGCYDALRGPGVVIDTATTDARGGFRFEGLPAAHLKVTLSHGYEPRVPLGERRLAWFTEPIDADLGPGRPHHLDLGVRSVVEARPFVYEATVELDPGWARRYGVGPKDLLPEVEWQAEPDPDDPQRPHWGWRLPDLEYEWRTGLLRCQSHTPAPPVRVVLSVPRIGRVAELELYPRQATLTGQRIAVPGP